MYLKKVSVLINQNTHYSRKYLHIHSFIYSGEVSVRFILHGKEYSDRNTITANYVPDRLLEKINRLTASMMESGLYDFYTSMAEFDRHLRLKDLEIDEDDELKPLTFDHMKRVMILFLFLIGIAVIVFILEVYLLKWITFVRWLTRKYQIVEPIIYFKVHNQFNLFKLY